MAEAGWTLRSEKDLAWLSFDGWDGIRCFHSTRLGGVSSPPFDTLNLSGSVGDLDRNVGENRRRFGALTGLNLSEVILNRQVHSDRVNVVSQDAEDYEGDALLTHQRGIPLGVSVADCLPVYIYDRTEGAIGLVHAGWKGTLQGIARKALLKMEEEFGAKPGDCSILFGPAIGPCCYEVSPEIAEDFDNQLPGSIIDRAAELQEAGCGPFLDLCTANELQLREIGVREIIGSGFCTSCRKDLFFSHRRDGGRTGRMLAVIEKL